ncbi:MAG: proton-conducting transporter membrane subunit, partial [Candidatus Omnitrophota bacterium]
MRLLVFLTLIPLLAAFLTALLGNLLKKRENLIANCASFVLLLISLKVAQLTAIHKVIVYKIGGWNFPLGVLLVADGLSSFLLVVVNIVVFLVLIYSVGYMRHYTGRWKFYTLFMLMLSGINGVIISGDLFNCYVFLELSSICAYILVAFGLEPEHLEASFKYAVMGAAASIFILLGIALLYGYTSTLNMSDMADALSAKPQGFLIGFISVLFLAGFGLKAALVPFHAWLPDAHSSAPTPVSAVLSGVFIKALGVYAISRIFFNVIGVTDKILQVLMLLGIISMAVGAFLAVSQNDMKRMLAYSSISQLGYIIFALGVGTPLALLGGIFHLFNHASAKSLLFLNAGSIEHATGRRELDGLGGLNSKLPLTSNTSLIGAMSISGIPPFAGFWSKLIIIIAAIQAGYIGFSAIAVLVSIVTLVY